ncbi:cytochrome c [Pelomonas sp. V22]|uniref:c-type cytochrome n=1 Tax=Pelomonas sp. V22 TaxID=2822139 RepID=UPI0024A8F02F|nr:cytochrome c [Pelomonas sp. V22]MDI4634468.1 cytochrome c [Pelomonas sp. V22]
MKRLLLLSLLAGPALAADTPATLSQGWQFQQRSGPALFASICAGCHMAEGQGARGAGAYPALKGNARLASAQYVLMMVMRGNKGMPGFAWQLDDEQVLTIANHAVQRFGPAGSLLLKPTDVAAMRSQMPRQEPFP